jgi:hypothetical protein
MTSPTPTPTSLAPSSLRATGPGLRLPTNRKTIYDRNLNRTKNAELSRAAFAYLFIEMINYASNKVTGVTDLEKRYNTPPPPQPHRPSES